MSRRDLRGTTAAQVRSAMTAAMRADPRALDLLVERNAGTLDPYTLSFVRTARTLALATSAALNTVLTAHRYGRDADGQVVCLACGISRCRTVRAVSDVLAAYGLRTAPVDRPEAWRLADAWYTKTAGHPVLLSVEPFDRGFVVRPADPPSGTPGGVLIIDRDTGEMTLWPSYDTPTLVSQYHAYQRGAL
ncbi:hypothetical protein BZB76_4419 [Actinomadura pelletieri DSM 43383]|uniref:Uncharacterized protein n=1 Tax=Actinomadura pelletieri DSM 43383 TaxID=1120940 RepID=A0A495QME9_9ACTN|nr:hypothetical protein [Actinomadura pelletieri]RKS73716.1 hypothetical protein BZB76_4419 [Actinomadura pelletieri DSM 43383]